MPIFGSVTVEYPLRHTDIVGGAIIKEWQPCINRYGNDVYFVKDIAKNPYRLSSVNFDDIQWINLGKDLKHILALLPHQVVWQTLHVAKYMIVSPYQTGNCHLPLNRTKVVCTNTYPLAKHYLVKHFITSAAYKILHHWLRVKFVVYKVVSSEVYITQLSRIKFCRNQVTMMGAAYTSIR